MPDLQKVGETKERILSTIKEKGPAYPAKIARESGLSPLFTAAFLSELVSDRKLKISNMKVGSSPIYYIEGQEQQLEVFTEHLNHKEREAFEKLRKSMILEDLQQEPAIRVALRKIKDFAIPINVRIDGDVRLFWRYSQFPEEETREKIRTLISPSQSPRHEIKQEIKQKVNEEKEANQEIKRESDDEKVPTVESIIDEEKKDIKQAVKKIQTSDFAESIKDYLAAKDIEVLEELSAKKREFIAKIRTDIIFGKQEYLLTAKEKKKVSQDDLAIATQKAQAEKMPALFISPGELDKTAYSYLETWRNMIKFEKVKI